MAGVMCAARDLGDAKQDTGSADSGQIPTRTPCIVLLPQKIQRKKAKRGAAVTRRKAVASARAGLRPVPVRHIGRYAAKLG